MKIKTRYFADEVYTAENENKNTLTIDMREPDKKDNMSPMEIVLSALCACVAVEVVGMIKKRRKTVSDLIIDAEGERREYAPRSFTHITLKFTLVSPDANNEEMHKVTTLAAEKYCSVGSSLNAEISIKTNVIQP